MAAEADTLAALLAGDASAVMVNIEERVKVKKAIGSYVVYRIRVCRGDGSEWFVERRYSELLALHKGLRAKYTFVSVKVPKDTNKALNAVLMAELRAVAAMRGRGKRSVGGRGSAADMVALSARKRVEAELGEAKGADGVALASTTENLFALFPPKSVSPDLDARQHGLNAYIQFVMANPSLRDEPDVRTMFALHDGGVDGGVAIALDAGRADSAASSDTLASPRLVGSPSSSEYMSVPASSKLQVASSVGATAVEVGALQVPTVRLDDSGKYHVYEIHLYRETDILDAAAQPYAVLLRRYSQFLQLHRELGTEFDRSSSLTFMIDFPPKSGMKKPSDAELETRRAYFEALLVGAVGHPLMSRSATLIEFLAVDSQVHSNLDLFATVTAS
ncbi:uncharacterized protein AMSG_01188 [Thecamonas trahens ATCC 50062]|uniref:PX domain-containing protein n=1 Tax=Thecamonas trahens ATCC 50062 TaxID=461836 RepID=A0A0L0DMC6_THETB|nr:hypothetical protein AMSG_01188 [Thecamonas trahens ATCC 50062]KNC53474.1 hypothetical protein AMSG_01188 [Thecamonas trahens ATCC 50062]|eukprot:XP_013761798.1 hypothetical protein AMSG_01188 [Thecamonas trahens ATCC 50062]